MCGINGRIHLTDKENLVLQLQSMNGRIIHRGPDDDGYYIDSHKEYSIGMAMRRLSIIDLEAGIQPIVTNDGKLVIVFNGEIYNYLSLRSSLMKAGVIFSTQSDTEVILKLYEKYGTSGFSMLDGMFAFSIYDKSLQKVFIGRDYFGEKPLYYLHNSDGFYWASELKSIIQTLKEKPALSALALNLYFRLTYIPAPYSIYEGIFKLESNKYLEYDLCTKTFNIFDIEQGSELEPQSTNFEDAKRRTHDLVFESVASRSISDVPIGTFLSGGVDSSIISLCLAQQNSNKVSTFSIGFENKAFDESNKAKVVSKLIGSNHHEFIISEKDLEENIEAIILNFDEPFSDSSALPTYLVSQKTSMSVKVALTGDGGDEVFGGYNKYYMGKINESYTKIVSHQSHSILKKALTPLLNVKTDNRGMRFKLKKLLDAVNHTGDFYYDIISLAFNNGELGDILKNANSYTDVFRYYKDKLDDKKKDLAYFRGVDKIISLEGDMLVKVDRTSMLSSIECRAPFLSKKLWHFTSQMPEEFLINKWDKKYILKKAFENYFPNKFLSKSKMGFGVPVGDWLKKGLRSELVSFVQSDLILNQNIFEVIPVQKLVYDHVESRRDNTFKVWTFYCFQKWYFKSYVSN